MGTLAADAGPRRAGSNGPTGLLPGAKQAPRQPPARLVPGADARRGVASSRLASGASASSTRGPLADGPLGGAQSRHQARSSEHPQRADHPSAARPPSTGALGGRAPTRLAPPPGHRRAPAPPRASGAGAPGGPRPAPPNSPSAVIIEYESTWPRAILRCSVNGGPWGDVALTPVASGGGRWHSGAVEVPTKGMVASVSHSVGGVLGGVFGGGAGKGGGGGKGGGENPGAGDGDAAAAAAAAKGAAEAAPSPNASGSARAGSSASPPTLEFAVHDGRGRWDGPALGANYVASEPGRYRVSRGAARREQRRPFLLACDLDDTLVGDARGLAEFSRWWLEEAPPRGARLAYATGRPLALFERLAREQPDLPRPDLLIAAVGTEVFVWGKPGAGDEGAASGGGGGGATAPGRGGAPAGTPGWQRDLAWDKLLDRDWDAGVVRDACYAAREASPKGSMHFRPPEEQNDHKVTCGVRADALQGALAVLRESLKGGGVPARLVVSGDGEWRFVDVLPVAAGKAAALAHVRQRLGFDTSQLVAAGDSGNDVDMLEAAGAGIVVSNAQPDLDRWLAGRAGRKGASNILRTSKPRAWGVLEGLRSIDLVSGSG